MPTSHLQLDVYLNLKFSRSQTKLLIFIPNQFHSCLLLLLLMTSPCCSRQKSWNRWLTSFPLIPCLVSKQILLAAPSEPMIWPFPPSALQAPWFRPQAHLTCNSETTFTVVFSLLLLLHSLPHRPLSGDSQRRSLTIKTSAFYVCSELINMFTFCSG